MITSIAVQRFKYYYYHIVAVIIMNATQKIITVGGDDEVTYYDKRDVELLYNLLITHNGFPAFERAEELISAQNGESYLLEILDSTKNKLLEYVEGRNDIITFEEDAGRKIFYRDGQIDDDLSKAYGTVLYEIERRNSADKLEMDPNVLEIG